MPNKELYHFAAAFYKTKLWERLYDSELFAVKLPNGELGYISVMGALGEHLALAVYPGNDGLNSYRKLADAAGILRNAERREYYMSQDCVMCSFEKRDELRPLDLEEIKEYKLTFRGRQAYPFFQRFRPRYYPWYLSSETDEETLRLGLLAGIEVARRLNGAAVQQDLFHAPDQGLSKEELGFTEGAPFDREIPFLIPQIDGTFVWEKTPLPKASRRLFSSPRLADDIALIKLKKMKRSGTWECGMMMHPEPFAKGEGSTEEYIENPKEAPYYPFMLLMVDHANGMVLHFGLESAPDDSFHELADAFIDGLMKSGVPKEILVRDERTHALLAGFAKQIGIQVSIEEDLPFLDEAEDSFTDSIGEGTEKDQEGMLNRLLDTVDEKDLPDEMRQQLTGILEGNILSQDMAEKLERYLSGKGNTSGKKPAAKPKKKKIHKVEESFVISVSLGTGCYRHILISANETLFTLHDAILDAFEFVDDHAHAFFMDNRAFSDADSYYVKGIDDARRYTSDYTLKEAGLIPGLKFKYVFNFGEEWTFSLKVLREQKEAVQEPMVIRSVGVSPEQYGDLYDDDEEDEGLINFPEVYNTQKLKKLYAELQLPKEAVRLLHKYFDAFAELYEIIPLRKALEIYNKQNLPLSQDEFAAFCEIVRHESHIYSILGEDDLYDDIADSGDPLDREIIHESLLMGDGDYEEMKVSQEGKPYYIPGKQVLLKYAGIDYINKNAYFLKLRNFLYNRMQLAQNRAEDIAEQLELHAVMAEDDMEYILDDMKRMGLSFSNAEEVEAFMNLFTDMYNNTRMPINRGHTPNELIKVTPPRRYVKQGAGNKKPALAGNIGTQDKQKNAANTDSILRADHVKPQIAESFDPAVNQDHIPDRKVSRNELCPCGSGKKYKRCCGKNEM